MFDLGTLGGTSSGATGINNRGDIVGFSRIATGERHAFLFRGGVMIGLGTLGGAFSFGRAINDRGDVVGDADTTVIGNDGFPIFQAFLYDRGGIHDLGTLP